MHEGPNLASADPAFDLSHLCRYFSERSSQPMLAVEGETCIVRHVNPAFLRLARASRSDLIGRPFALCVPEGQANGCVSLLARVYHTGKPETLAEQKHGEAPQVHWSYSVWPILGGGERPVGVMIQVTDSTETAIFRGQAAAMNEALLVSSIHQHELTGQAVEAREAVEKLNTKLRQSEERYRALFQSVPVGVFVCDRDAVVRDYNRRAAESWGRSPKRGDPAERYCGSFKLYRPDGTPLPREQSPVRDVLLTGAPRENVEVLIERPDHSRLPVLVNAFPLNTPDGGIVGVIATFSDITLLKGFEREREALLASEQASRMEAEAANRAKDVFLATLSHEMRTPLSAIVGWMSILRGEKCDAEDLREGLEVIERNTRAQAQLMEDVLDVSRIVSGKMRLEMCLCDMIETINAGVAVVRPAAEARGIALDVRLDPSASRASCDPARIQQIVWNLVSNAIKFTPEGGTVRVTLAREQATLRLEVSDTGQGMGPELLPFVFDRFRQADSSTRRKYGGLGLGLSIVKHLVEMHGGTVEAQSAGAGRGSTFTVRLPVRAVGVYEIGEETGAGGAAGGADGDDAGHAAAYGLPLVRLDGLRVLVVDDEPDARRLLAKVLRQAGALVTAAASAAEALEALPKVHPEVLVSDLGMPDEDGFDLMRQVRGLGHHARDLPAVALTAFVRKEDQRQALLAGFQVHVPKPVDPHDLTAVIASLAGRTG